MNYWVFDLDGTLVDSFKLYFQSLEGIFAKHGACFTEDLHYPALTEPLVPFFAHHLGSAAVNDALAELQTRSNRDATQVRAFQGMLDGIEALKKRGKKVAIWTNRDLESAQLIVKHSGLEKLVEMMVSGTCVVRRKPDPQGLLRIIESFECKPGQVTMVGDHEHDVTAAKAVGARAVRASWHAYWDVERCRHADFQFHDVDTFVKWMGSHE